MLVSGFWILVRLDIIVGLLIMGRMGGWMLNSASLPIANCLSHVAYCKLPIEQSLSFDFYQKRIKKLGICEKKYYL
jgi:hypothetical protein